MSQFQRIEVEVCGQTLHGQRSGGDEKSTPAGMRATDSPGTTIHSAHAQPPKQRLADFEGRYNATATPFDWKFTHNHLRDLLTRIDHNQQQDQPANQATATRVPQAA